MFAELVNGHVGRRTKRIKPSHFGDATMKNF